jgi:hypothetical protein
MLNDLLLFLLGAAGALCVWVTAVYRYRRELRAAWDLRRSYRLEPIVDERPENDQEQGLLPLSPAELNDLGAGWPRPRRRRLAKLLIDDYVPLGEVIAFYDWPPECIEELIDSVTLTHLDATLQGAARFLELPEEAKL